MDTVSATSKPIPWNATQEQMDGAVEETVTVLHRKQDLIRELQIAYRDAAIRYRGEIQELQRRQGAK